MADKQITNPGGAYGYTDLQTKGYALLAPVKASAAITAKRVCSIGTDGTVAMAATNGTAALQIGISQTAIASGANGQVIVVGIAEDVPCDGAVSAGDPLKRSVTTTGSVAFAVTNTTVRGEVIGMAINDSSSNTVDVWVFKTMAIT